MRLLVRTLLSVCLLAPNASGWAEPVYQDKTFRITGVVEDGVLHAESLQLRDDDEDAVRGQISARIERPDIQARRLALGPFTVTWTSQTLFKDLSQSDIREGVFARFLVRERGGVLEASAIQQASPLGPGRLQITARIASEERDPQGNFRFRMLGQSVLVKQSGYNAAQSPAQRQDARRPAQPMSFPLLGREAIFTGEYDLAYRDRKNLKLDDRSRVRDLDHELKLELFVPWSDTVSFFVSGKGVYEDELERNGGTEATTKYLARDQTWIYFNRLGQSGLGLQLGRQNLRETREWWWDDDLDAARLYYDKGAYHAELLIGRELLKEKSNATGIDPKQRHVVRWAGQSSWLWAPKQSVDAFWLYHRDGSAREPVGSVVPESEEDSMDARLLWFGLRAIGDRSVSSFGDLRYWLDTAWVHGTQALAEYNSEDALSTVVERKEQRVRGSAIDAGLSWRTRLPARAAFTAAYAMGSGDSDPSDATDRSFRQTGLHNNKWRFHGVNRFRYYGELLRPELSNMEIGTFSLGLSLGENRSAELVYHRYRQAQASRAAPDTRVDGDPTGTSRELGEALDLILGTRQWRHVDMSLASSVFRAGEAYGPRQGALAYQLHFEMAVNF
jgi:alginate production protein